MKRFSILISTILLPVVILACGGSGDSSSDSFSMSILPSKFSADIPASISGDNSSLLVSRKSVSQKAIKAVGDISTGCQQMKQMTGEMKMFSSMAPLYAVLADAAISQNNITADEESHTVSITFTRGMFDTMSEIMSDDMSDISEMESFIGQSMTCGVLFSDNGSDAYKYSVKITMDDSTTTIYWSEDKKNTKLEVPIEAGSGEGATETGTLVFEYNDTEKLMTVSFELPSMSMFMSLKEQGDGALFFSNNKFGAYKYQIEGYADDNGGYIKYTSTDAYFGSFSYSEYFDGNGNITVDNSTYGSEYTSGAEDITALQEDVGLDATLSSAIADGDYIVMSSSGKISAAGEIDDLDSIIGFGTVIDGTTLVIQDVGCAAYDDLATGDTIFLYVATTNADGSITFNEASESRTITF